MPGPFRQTHNKVKEGAMAQLSTDLLKNFQELIYRQCSLRFSPSRISNLQIQLQERVRRREIASYEDYLHLLLEDAEEFDALIEGITTKETHFFRFPEQFKALERVVLPRIETWLAEESQILMEGEGWPGHRKVPLRIWSAGCATGEEPYSIAMTLMEGLKYPRAWKIEILATDISKEAVTAASLGFYETGSLKRIPAHYQQKYMKMGNGGGVVTEELAEMLSFRIFNLRNLDVRQGSPFPFVTPDGRGEGIDLFERFHIIFCRNVMIYFDFIAQQHLVEQLYACLRPGGFLFTGDAELLHIYRHSFETLNCEGAYLYQKPGSETIKKETPWIRGNA